MANERRPPRRRGKRKRGFLFGIITFFFICGALLLGVSVFFKISVIKVEGSTRYTPEQVVQASGIKTGDNLFFVNKFDATSRIFKYLPYAETVTMKRDLPNIIVISIKDAEAVAYIQDGDSRWLMDKSCKLLEKTQDESASGLIPISGASPAQPEAGQKLKLGDSTKQNALFQLMSEFVSRGMLKDVRKIDLANPGDIKFYYLGRFNVKLGNSEDIKAKLDLLQTALDSKRITPTATGTIDLSQKKEAHFIAD